MRERDRETEREGGRLRGGDKWGERKEGDEKNGYI